MPIRKMPILRWLFVPYTPSPDACDFQKRALNQSQDGVDVTLAVLDARESQQFFGVPLARRGVQPVWLRIANRSSIAYRLNMIGIDQNYYSPHEAAAANHYSSGKRLLEFGLLAWIFFPFLWLLPVKLFFVRQSNRKMDDYFQEHGFRLKPILPGHTSEGFVFTPLDSGNKVIHIVLFGPDTPKEFLFTVNIPGLAADYLGRDLSSLEHQGQTIPCDLKQLVENLKNAPATTTNRDATKAGDPANLVVIGDFSTILSSFGARWDETETINFATSWKTARAFLTGSAYRYSPVSALYLFGRSQDFALQRIRRSINDRLHLRLWLTPFRYNDKAVWLGQVSRDIGVRFTWKTWNLTTHRIDPDVDEARDYVVEDLLQAQRSLATGYVDGVGETQRSSPKHNLTGDPYYTDGKRAVILVSPSRTTPKFVSLL